KGLGFLEGRPVVVINSEVEHVVRHHPEHHPVAEHAGLAEHTPHCDAAERSELLAQELGKVVAGNHPPSSVLARRSWLPQDRADDTPSGADRWDQSSLIPLASRLKARAACQAAAARRRRRTSARKTIYCRANATTLAPTTPNETNQAQVAKSK